MPCRRGRDAPAGPLLQFQPMELEAPRVHAPEFPEADWVNTASPPTLAGLRGQVVLVDIWDFT